MMFSVTLSAASNLVVTVDVATADVSAISSNDYQHVMGTFTFNPGETTKTVSVDRKSTRLNSSHANISYAVFCLKKKKKKIHVRCFVLTHINNSHYHNVKYRHQMR